MKLIAGLLTIVICLLIVGVTLLVFDISERYRGDTLVTKAESPVVLPPLVLPSPVFPSSDFPYPMREINYISHISGRVTVMDNPNARDVSYSELLNFLLEDQTDKIIYVENSFTCSDFSQTLQHNAEMKGIHCAWVYVDLLEISDHSLNAFRTDRGLIFIDDSGVEANVIHPFNMDKTVILNRGQGYCPDSLFPESGWTIKWMDKQMGTIIDYKIYWVGDM